MKKLSVFKYYIAEAKKRRKPLNITPEYLNEIWDEQEGRCVFSGIKLKLRGSHSSIFDLASLDRIDSAKGYVVGNVQFVVNALNLAKNSEDNKKFIRFLDKLTKEYPY